VLAPAPLAEPVAAKGKPQPLPDKKLAEFAENYYETNPIARASAVMAELSALSQDAELGATGTHG
jgi:NADH-quinone oxidoreductase subunit G